ncbi:hypothetical protein Tco_0297694 [Tanacetum coccineum]
MVVLDSCPKHNMVAYTEFHEVIDFLVRSSIHHALTLIPVVSTTFVEQFWTSAKSKIINNVRSSQGNYTLEGTDQEAQEASQTCYYTPQSLDEECILGAKIGRKESLKEELDAKGVCIQTGEEICQG